MNSRDSSAPDTSALDHAAEVGRVLGDLGARFYFDPATLAKGKQHGLDGFRFYFLGRGGVLGDVEPEVVTAAFGYFAPALVANMWNSAREVMAPREAARLFNEACQDYGRAHLADVADLDAFCADAEAVVDATDVAGLSLYAGWAAEPLPDDAPARAMQLAAVLRELRGSVHLAAVVSVGLTGQAAHAVARPGDVGMFGWDEATVSVGEAEKARWRRAEELTNERMADFFSVLDDRGRETLLHVATEMGAACS